MSLSAPASSWTETWTDRLPPGRWEEIISQLNFDAFIEPICALREQLETQEADPLFLPATYTHDKETTDEHLNRRSHSPSGHESRPKNFLRNLHKLIIRALLRASDSRRMLRLVNLRLWALRIKRYGGAWEPKLSASDWCAGHLDSLATPGSAWSDDGHVIAPKRLWMLYSNVSEEKPKSRWEAQGVAIAHAAAAL